MALQIEKRVGCNSEWTESREIDRIALKIVMIRAALTFWDRPHKPLMVETEFDKRFPPTQREREIIAKWHSFPLEAREAALDRTLTHFMGGVLLDVKSELEKHPISKVVECRCGYLSYDLTEHMQHVASKHAWEMEDYFVSGYEAQQDGTEKVVVKLVRGRKNWLRSTPQVSRKEREVLDEVEQWRLKHHV